jgi:hypothetical protein
MSRTDAHGGESRTQLLAHSLAPDHVFPIIGGQRFSQLFDGHRLMLSIP